MRFVDVKTKLTNYSVVPNDLYGIGISSTALVLYAKLLNRTNLSISNNRVDEFGRVYVLYKLEDLAQELGRSVSAIKSNMNELVSAGLIEKRRADKGRANMIFVKVPESSVTDTKLPQIGAENKPYYGSKIVGSRGVKVASNNYKNNTKIITNYDFEEGESL